MMRVTYLEIALRICILRIEMIKVIIHSWIHLSSICSPLHRLNTPKKNWNKKWSIVKQCKPQGKVIIPKFNLSKKLLTQKEVTKRTNVNIVKTSHLKPSNNQ